MCREGGGAQFHGKGRVTKSYSMWNKNLIDVSHCLSWLLQDVPCRACPWPAEAPGSFSTSTGKTCPWAAAGTDSHSIALGHNKGFHRGRAFQLPTTAMCWGSRKSLSGHLLKLEDFLPQPGFPALSPHKGISCVPIGSWGMKSHRTATTCVLTPSRILERTCWV